MQLIFVLWQEEDLGNQQSEIEQHKIEIEKYKQEVLNVDESVEKLTENKNYADDANSVRQNKKRQVDSHGRMVLEDQEVCWN